MKHEAQQMRTTERTIRQSITNAFTGKHQIVIPKPENGRFFNIFLIQNKGKGPPGRQRSPGTSDDLFPGQPPDSENPVRFRKPGRIESPSCPSSVFPELLFPEREAVEGKAYRRQFRMNLNTEYQIITNNHSQIFLTIKFLQS